MASKVAGSMAKPSRAAKRMARSSRRWSSRKALLGIADGPHHAALQVGAALHVIQNLAVLRIEHQAVDGEIAAQHVGARVGFEMHGAGAAAIGVLAVAAEGRDFHLRRRSPAPVPRRTARPRSRNWGTGPGCGPAERRWPHRNPSAAGRAAGRARIRPPGRPGGRRPAAGESRRAPEPRHPSSAPPHPMLICDSQPAPGNSWEPRFLDTPATLTCG